MSQSFYGISRGDKYNNGNNGNNGNLYAHRSLVERCDGASCNDNYGYYGAQYHGNGGGYDNRGHDDDGDTDVQLFCLWAGECSRLTDNGVYRKMNLIPQ
jgi:hypothetical protein